MQDKQTGADRRTFLMTAAAGAAATVLPAATAASRSALIPMDSVSSARPAAFNWSNTALALACRARAATKFEAGSGIVMMPRSRRPGSAATARASASASAGATPAFVGPPSTLT